jgi:hypothetical protein
VGLLAGEAVETGTLLSVELFDSEGKVRLTIMASVTRVTSGKGAEWAVGCSFIRELSDKELKALV